MVTEGNVAETIAYYDAHAMEFYAGSVGADMRPLYAPFLALIPERGHILDAGCGSGRDSRYFLEQGYEVTAFDASARMVELSSRLLNRPVLRLPFQDLAFQEAFEGIWACASLLHVPRAEMDSILPKLAAALKAGGVLFASFKYGDGEVARDGRHFNSYDERAFAALLARHRGWEPLGISVSHDVRPGRADERWLNAILRKG